MENLEFYKKCAAEGISTKVVFHQIDKENQQYVARGDGFTLVMPLRMLVTAKNNDTDMIWNTPVIGKRLSEEIEVFITSVDEENGIVNCSRDSIRALMKERETKEIDEYLAKKKGNFYVIKGRVAAVFGRGSNSHVKLLTESGLKLIMHCSEWSYDYIEDLHDHVKIGEEYDVAIIHRDKEEKDTDYVVSRRPVLPNPWADIEKKVKVGDIVVGRIVGRRKGSFNARIEGLDGITALSLFPDKDKKLRLVNGGRYQCEVLRVGENPRTLIIKPFAEKR